MPRASNKGYWSMAGSSSNGGSMSMWEECGRGILVGMGVGGMMCWV